MTSRYVMDADTREQWLKDLRSGNFRQADGKLAERGVKDRKYRYCCLGVLGFRCGLLETEAVRRWSGEIIKHQKNVTDGGASGFLFKAGATDPEYAKSVEYRGRPLLSPKLQSKLAEMNDEGMKFREIADYIEDHTRPRGG